MLLDVLRNYWDVVAYYGIVYIVCGIWVATTILVVKLPAVGMHMAISRA